MKIDERAAALIALVEADLAERTHAVLDPAASRAREELREARRSARSRVATAIAEERTRYASRVAAAEARLATARRMASQKRLRALIAEGWTLMPGVLATRWADAEGRRAWVGAALAHARAILPADRWRVEGPVAWSTAEREAAAADLAAHGIEATFAGDEAIAAGLRVLCRNVELDATLAGLLADRAAIEGRLLHWYESESA